MSGNQIHCGICGQVGHNRRTCPRNRRGGGNSVYTRARRPRQFQHPPETTTTTVRVGGMEIPMQVVPPINNQVNDLRIAQERVALLEHYIHRLMNGLREDNVVLSFNPSPENLVANPFDIAPETPTQPTKTPAPTHIAEQVWLLNEPDCQICLSKIPEKEYTLSACGHDFCKTCYEDRRLLKCGVCRKDL